MASYEKNVILTSTSASGDKYTIFPKTKIECVEGLKEALSGDPQESANIINDKTPSGSTTYSATKIEALFDEQKEAIDAVDSVYYNATAYGISTEAEDNTPALQALMDAVNEAGGGVIWFPVGVYKFKKAAQRYAVLAKSNVSVVGENIEKTVFKQVESAPYSLFYYAGGPNAPITGASYTNFTVDAYETGDTNAVYGKAFFYQYVKNCVFRDLILRGTIATAMGIDYLDQVTINNVTCVDCGRTYNGTQSGTSGIGIGTGGWVDENVIITNCVCVGCGQYGIFLENQHNLGWGGSVDYSAGAIISNCVVRNGLNKGIGVRGGENVTIIGCEVYENASHGVYLDNKCKNVKVTSCSVTANQGDGIRLEPSAESKRVHIRDCTVCDNTGAGMMVNRHFDGLTIVNTYTDGNNLGLSVGEVILSNAVLHNNAILDGETVAATFTGNTVYNDYNEETVIMPESITAQDVSVTEGGVTEVSYTVYPDGASNTVTFSSTSESVATVSNAGVVSGVSPGTCQITIVSKVDSNVSTTINCTVSAAQTAEPITISNSDFVAGKKLDSNGAEVDESGAGVTGFIDIKQAGLYSLRLNNFSGSGTIAMYDEAGSTFEFKTDIAASESTFLPANQKVRISVDSVDGVSGTIEIVEPAKVCVSNFTENSKLLPDGFESQENGHVTSDYVAVGNCATITVKPQFSISSTKMRVGQYDSNKVPIGGNYEQIAPSNGYYPPVTILDGCEYVRLCIFNGVNTKIKRLLIF